MQMCFFFVHSFEIVVAAGARKAVVIANLKKYVSWAAEKANAIQDSGIEIYVYHSDNKHKADPHFVPNIGNEATKYLRFILNNFENLPEHTLFLHGHEFSYHSIKCSSCWNGKDTASSRKDCQVSARDIVLNWDWSEPCYRPVPGKIIKLSCNKLRRNNLNYLSKISGVYGYLTMQERKDMCFLRGTGNAQFGVSKSCILRNSKKVYENLYTYLINNGLKEGRSKSKEKSVELENFWMFLFSRRGNQYDQKCLPNMDTVSNQLSVNNW